MVEKKATIELETQHIGKLLMKYSIPAIIAMTASSLYNIVDSVFIGQGVGSLAISGLALTFPLMNLAVAFGTLVGVGAATLVSVYLGQKDYQTSERVLGNAVLLFLIIGIVFSIITYIFLNPILYFFGGSERTIVYARQYMSIILLGNVVTHLYFGLNALLRASGHPKDAMVATIVTVLLNAILDPLFIFGLGWGIRGAAIATVISQVVSLVWQLKLFSNSNELLHFQKNIFWLKKRIVINIISIGMAPFLMNVAACFVVILINQGLKRYGGDLAVGAYGIANRIGFVFVMLVMGLNQGMQPIVGYNYGAMHFPRVFKTLRLTIIGATILTTIGFLISVFFSRLVVSAFTTDPELIRLSARGLRIVLFMFPFVGSQMVISNFFQNIGMVKNSIILSLSRQVIILIPCLLILPLYFGQDGVWISMPISDFFSELLAIYMLIREIRILRKKMLI